jgi:RNA polymerase sigma-70 factor (ECF subfamily)
MLSPSELTWLLDAISRRDGNAFERLYAATSAKLYGVVLRILRRHDLAQDVLEQTYMQIWNTAGDFDPTQASPFAWLVGLARRRAIDLARRPDTMANDAEPDVAEADGAAVLPRRELTEELKRLLGCLGRLDPDRQRMVLLAYYGAFSREQLASKLDMPANLLKSSLRRSLFEIEQCLTA